MVLAHTSAVYFLIWLSCSFIISALFFLPFPLVLVLVLARSTSCGYVCVTPTQMREKVLLRLNMCCAFFFFLQCEQYKIIKPTEEVFLLTADVKNRDIILDLGQCFNFTFSSQWISRGRLFSFQTPSELPAQCYRGWSLGRVGRGSDTRQVDRSLPISCSQLFHLSGELSRQMQPTAPRRDRL